MTERYSFPCTESEGEGIEEEPDPVPPEPNAGPYGTTRRRAPRLSREDVFEAADGLLIQGVRGTIDRVRQTTGPRLPQHHPGTPRELWAGRPDPGQSPFDKTAFASDDLAPQLLTMGSLVPPVRANSGCGWHAP